MRILALLSGLCIAAGAVAQDQSKPPAAAQDQAKPPAAAQGPAKPAAAPQELDKDTLTRIRAERFAGGLGNITPEEKANANVGAGPHRHSKPDGAARREPGEGPSENAGTGATR